MRLKEATIDALAISTIFFILLSAALLALKPETVEIADTLHDAMLISIGSFVGTLISKLRQS